MRRWRENLADGRLPLRRGEVASLVASLTNIASFIAAATILRYPGRYPLAELAQSINMFPTAKWLRFGRYG
jgi:hypothetical protein